jgi:hypothetical protein
VLAHPLGPGFGAEDADPQRQFAQLDAEFVRAFDHMGEIARCAAERGDVEVAHEHDLTIGVAARDRDHGCAQRLAALVGRPVHR